jgi:predicted nucleic acid-binding protein
MILLDTNVVVALVDERDRLHARARRDLRKLSGPFAVISVVLSETCFLLEQSHLRKRLRLLLERLSVRALELEEPWWGDVFDWLARYADHEPDLCDAMLAVLASRNKSQIWTYDSEFRKLWRAPDGRPLHVVPTPRGASRAGV